MQERMNDVGGSDCDTALAVAALQCNLRAIKMLVEELGANVSLENTHSEKIALDFFVRRFERMKAGFFYLPETEYEIFHGIRNYRVESDPSWIELFNLINEQHDEIVMLLTPPTIEMDD